MQVVPYNGLDLIALSCSSFAPSVQASCQPVAWNWVLFVCSASWFLLQDIDPSLCRWLAGLLARSFCSGYLSAVQRLAHSAALFQQGETEVLAYQQFNYKPPLRICQASFAPCSLAALTRWPLPGLISLRNVIIFEASSLVSSFVEFLLKVFCI